MIKKTQQHTEGRVELAPPSPTSTLHYCSNIRPELCLKELRHKSLNGGEKASPGPFSRFKMKSCSRLNTWHEYSTPLQHLNHSRQSPLSTSR